MIRDLVIDAYSALSRKRAVGTDQRTSPGPTLTPPGWVPNSEKRRLRAYMTLAAYRVNSARLLLDDPLAQANNSEYGDAALIIDRVVAGVLGQDWGPIVDGADEDLPDEPDLPPEPEPLPDGATDIERRIHAVRQARWDAEVAAIVDQWEADWAAQPALQQRQAELRQWVEDRLIDARILEAETDAATMGDTVMVLWPVANGWPRVEVYDPAGYFPVLGDDDHADYPSKVHLAWEFDDPTPMGGTARKLRRITFELVPIADLRVTEDRRGTVVWADADGQPADKPVLRAREGLDPATGAIWRLPLWADTSGDEASQVAQRTFTTCIVSDGVWDIDRLGTPGTADALDEANATWRVLADGTQVRRLDLEVDFLPVVHIPNTPTGKQHYGESVLSVISQLLDDLIETDTSTMVASRYVRDPAIAVAGADPGSHSVVAPGQFYGLGQQGRMDVLDLSAGLEKLQAFGQALLDRLSVNGRVPAEMLGRVTSADAVSGIALALALAPFAQLVGTLRMARDPKYRLLLRFAQRLAQVQGALEPGPTPRARVQFGSFLPTNRAETVTMVTEARKAGVISTQTAVAMLVAAGFPIDDARAEVERIERENTDRARAIFETTGDEQAAADSLGVQVTIPAVPPTGVPGRPAPQPGGGA